MNNLTDDYKIELAEKFTAIALESKMFRNHETSAVFAKDVVEFYETIYSELSKED